VHIRVFLSIIEFIGYDLFSVAICEEIYRARWDDADQSRHETFKQRTWRLVSRNIPKVLWSRVMGI